MGFSFGREKKSPDNDEGLNEWQDEFCGTLTANLVVTTGEPDILNYRDFRASPINYIDDKLLFTLADMRVQVVKKNWIVVVIVQNVNDTSQSFTYSGTEAGEVASVVAMLKLMIVLAGWDFVVDAHRRAGSETIHDFYVTDLPLLYSVNREWIAQGGSDTIVLDK